MVSPNSIWYPFQDLSVGKLVVSGRATVGHDSDNWRVEDVDSLRAVNAVGFEVAIGGFQGSAIEAALLGKAERLDSSSPSSSARTGTCRPLTSGSSSGPATRKRLSRRQISALASRKPRSTFPISPSKSRRPGGTTRPVILSRS
jgi:hypothetical protein